MIIQEILSEFNQNWLIVLYAHHSPTLDNNFMGSEEILPPGPPLATSPEAVVKLIFSDEFIFENVVEALEIITADFLGVT